MSDLFRDCSKYAFMALIQADLDRMKSTWNAHRIRANKVSQNGIPDYLYYLPEYRGKRDIGSTILFLLPIYDIGLGDYSCMCDDADLDLCWQYACEKPQSTAPEFRTLADILMEEENLHLPANVEEVLTLYSNLVNLIDEN